MTNSPSKLNTSNTIVQYNIKMARNTPFQEAHCLQYGLEIVHRDPQTKDVAAVECQFCKFFGHDPKVLEATNDFGPSSKKRQREQTETVKMFKRPFRTTNYRSHLEHEHSQRWPIYHELSWTQKQSFWKKHHNFKSTINHAWNIHPGQVPNIFQVNRNIVDEILAKMFHPDDHDGICGGNEGFP